MINSKKINAYYNRQASCFVLSGILNDLKLLKDERYNLKDTDFIDKLHRILFVCLYNLSNQGLEKVSISDIEAYLDKNNIAAYKILFEDEENLEWLQLLQDNEELDNFDYYYNLVKKMSLMRAYIEGGVDVSRLLDKSEIDMILIQKQEEKFDSMTIQDIIDYFDRINANIKSGFDRDSNENSGKAGKGDLELFKKLKEIKPYGLNTECGILNTVSRGFLPQKFLICSMGTGQGKSRNSIKRCVITSVSQYYDIGLKKWIDNPNGENHPSLYIGTELSMEEIKLIMWATISGVSQDRIEEGRMTNEEEERVLKGISILENTPIYIENNEDYNCLWIKNIIEKHKRENNIELVALDYIELTPSLESEFCSNKRGIAPREDLVLLNLSKVLKTIANKEKVCIIGYTQVNDNAYSDMSRDNRCIKGCKSLPNKADLAYSVFSPTEKEMKLIEPYLKNLKGYKKNLTPNACYSIYKNRGGKYNAVKIWCYVNLGNMEVVELFSTDWNYNLINIESTIIKITD